MASKKMLDKFQAEVMVHESAMDELGPDDGLDHLSLVMGWALAQGMAHDRAFKFALDAVYN